MNRIKNITALLDLTYIDPVVIRYADYVGGIVEAEKIDFLHVIQEYDLPEKGGRELPDEAELYAFINEKIKEVVEDNFSDARTKNVYTRVEPEDAATAVIDFISETEADLLLIGHKYGSNHQCRYGHKISSGVDCDIMYIPEMAEASVNKILCAIDCSKESEVAFKRALALAEKTGAKMICHFIYDTAQTYFPATTVTASETRQENFKKRFDRFLESFDLSPGSIECFFKEVDPAEHQAEKVYQTAVEEAAELIVVGAAGAVSSPTTVLGNMLGNFNNLELKIPLLVIKNQKSKRFFGL